MTTEKICSECGLPVDDIRHLQGYGNIHLRPGIDYEPEADSDESEDASDDEATKPSTTTASSDDDESGDGSEGDDGNPAAEPPQDNSVAGTPSGGAPAGPAAQDGVLKCPLCDHTEETPIKLGKHTKEAHELNLAGARAAAAEKGTS